MRAIDTDESKPRQTIISLREGSERVTAEEEGESQAGSQVSELSVNEHIV